MKWLSFFKFIWILCKFFFALCCVIVIYTCLIPFMLLYFPIKWSYRKAFNKKEKVFTDGRAKETQSES